MKILVGQAHPCRTGNSNQRKDQHGDATQARSKFTKALETTNHPSRNTPYNTGPTESCGHSFDHNTTRAYLAEFVHRLDFLSPEAEVPFYSEHLVYSWVQRSTKKVTKLKSETQATTITRKDGHKTCSGLTVMNKGGKERKKLVCVCLLSLEVHPNAGLSTTFNVLPFLRSFKRGMSI